MSRCFFIILFIIPSFALSQNKVRDTELLKSKITREKDTLIVIKQIVSDKAKIAYEEILAKTNSQLSLWFNPYGILIGILGVLVAFLAIAVAFVIFKQSRDAKELIKESLYKHQVALDDLINEKNSYFNNYIISLNDSIGAYKDKLASE